MYPTPDDASIWLTLNTMTSNDYKTNPGGINPAWYPNFIKYFSAIMHAIWTDLQTESNGFGAVNINTYDYVDQNFQSANLGVDINVRLNG